MNTRVRVKASVTGPRSDGFISCRVLVPKGEVCQTDCGTEKSVLNCDQREGKL